MPIHTRWLARVAGTMQCSLRRLGFLCQILAFIVARSFLQVTASLFAAEPGMVDSCELLTEIHRRADPLVAKSKVLGLAIGVIDGDEEVVVCVGKRSLFGTPIDEQTIFEIGSITKVFTGILLADAAVRKEVALDQPVVELLGKGAKAPSLDGRPIRLEDLATHTSGLPRLPGNMGLFINPFNPYANYHEDRLRTFLAEHELRRKPGATYEYSNLAMGLLGFALAERSGVSYEKLLEERITKPLGLGDTAVSLSDDQTSRMASGMSVAGLPAMTWDFPSLAGCGGLRSTIRDMLAFARANLNPDATTMAKAIRLSQKSRFTIRETDTENGESLSIGLGWHVTVHDGTKVVWHNGMTGGYASFMAVAPEKRWAVVVLGNSASPEIDKLANGLLLDMLHDKLPRASEAAD